MKKIILALLCFSTLTIFSQTTPSVPDVWSKSDRSNLFEDCMSYITKYKNLSNDQKESISLCYLDEVTKKYSRADFQEKIEIELRRIKDAIIMQCAKNLGLELATEAKIEPAVIMEKGLDKTIEPTKTTSTIITKEFLIGKWKLDNHTIIEFKSNATFIKTFLVSFWTSGSRGYIYANSTSTGDWFLDEKGILTIQETWTEDIGKIRTNNVKYIATGRFKIVSFMENYFRYQFLDGNYAGSLDSDKREIQANKVIE